MIVSEQDSETSLNRRKPRPPADAAWIWIDLLIGMFQEPLDGAGTPYTGISPPAVLTGCPLCLRRLTACQGRFNARTEAGQSYLPDMRVIAPKPATACLCAEGCSPYTSFLSWDHGLLNPARLSFRAHIGCIQCTYSIFKLSPARTDVPLPVHSCRMASVEMCLKLSRISHRG